MPQMTIAELDAFFDAHFPMAPPFRFRITALEDNYMELRLPFHERQLRPGGTVSGPVLMSLADTGAYALILAMIGPVALAVTTSLNINFLRKPAPADVIARTRMLKLGARLAICEISLYSDGSDDMVAHATVTYSIPPR
ncbi:MAG: PaaI family thioesterase [Blastocatellia bacterium]